MCWQAKNHNQGESGFLTHDQQILAELGEVTAQEMSQRYSSPLCWFKERGMSAKPTSCSLMGLSDPAVWEDHTKFHVNNLAEPAIWASSRWASGSPTWLTSSVITSEHGNLCHHPCVEADSMCNVSSWFHPICNQLTSFPAEGGQDSQQPAKLYYSHAAATVPT